MRCDGGLGEKKKGGGKRGIGVVDCVPNRQTNRTHRSCSNNAQSSVHSTYSGGMLAQSSPIIRVAEVGKYI